MIDRLLAELAPRDEKSAAAKAQLQLATTILLHSALPAGHVIDRTGVSNLIGELKKLFNLPPSKSNRLIRRAALIPQTVSVILACATLLKLKADVNFRQDVFAAAIRFSLADSTSHNFEIHLIERLAHLLNVSPTGARHAA
jgi:uncharacterized tellurite resistance protein B-like protein